MKNKKMHKLLYLFCLAFFVSLFVFSIINLTLYYIDLDNNKKENAELVRDVLKVDENDTDKVEVDFEKLLERNPDVVGWIKFNDDKINYPIVQSKDNNYYLRRGFNKEKNQAGSIFMNYQNKSFEDENVVIFGHAMKNGSMFASLDEVFEEHFFDKEENKYIQIINKNNKLILYQIFSYYIIEEEEYYITPTFNSIEDFTEFIKTIKSRSERNFGVEVDDSDKILTLSTCAGSANTTKRRVIHAVRIDE